MSAVKPFQFPKELERDRQKAKILSWLSVVLLASAAVLLGLTLGQSQTMKTAWIGDLLAIIPPIAALTAMRFEFRPATTRFPYGYSRAVSIAFLVAASALSFSGLWLFSDALMKLLHQERP
ncbi:MAG: cation transporter, partial [Gemmatimonadota bacterium]|nr:cation transporter [Gemmatimonadota bacterium]